jgi:SagB-type dehydrogenase family enzyme
MDVTSKRSKLDALRIMYEEPLFSPSEIYHEASKITVATGRAYGRHIQSVIGSESFLKRMAKGYKSYVTSPRFKLAEPAEISEPDPAKHLREIITRRRSVRRFSGRNLSSNDVAVLMQNAYGITGKVNLRFNIEENLRSVPSGGALYPLEIYAGCIRVQDIDPGLYHYNVLEHSLELVRAGNFGRQFQEAYFVDNLFDTAALLVIISGMPRRSSIKYQERAYRFMLLEAGHVGQNLCLSGCALGLGSVMLGGFMDDQVNDLLGLDGVNEKALYCAAFGPVQ